MGQTMMIKYSVKWGVTILLLLAIAACGGKKAEWQGKVTERDGVVIVSNPKKPLYENAEITIVQDLKIGVPEGDPEYLFTEITDLAVDDDGNIYAIDLKGNHVLVFDRNGRFLRTVGRPGQGPGEFSGAGNIHVGSNGEIMVTDEGSRSIKYFSPDGQYRRQYLLKAFSPIKVDYDSAGVYYIMDFSMEPPGFKLSRLDSRTEESSVLATWAMPMPDPKRVSIFDPIMSFAVMPDDRLLYGCPTEGYEILIFDAQGRLQKRILKDWDPNPVTDEEREAILDECKKRNPSNPVQLDFPRIHPPYRVVNCDDSGRIFVLSHSGIADDPSQARKTVFDVFDQEGRYIAIIRHQFKALIEKPMLWNGGKFYTVEQDEAGFLYIVRYSVSFSF
jgi:hypothetical protein